MFYASSGEFQNMRSESETTDRVKDTYDIAISPHSTYDINVHNRSGSPGDVALSPTSTSSSRQKSPFSHHSSSPESQHLASEAAASMSGLSDESFRNQTQDVSSRSRPDAAKDPSLGSKSKASYIGKCQLSPIGEMQPIELTESPSCNRKVVARLSRDYTDVEYHGAEGAEGAECEMAEGQITDDEHFHAQNMSGVTDSESDIERREALSHSDLLNNSREQETVHLDTSDEHTDAELAMSVGSLDRQLSPDEYISSIGTKVTLLRSQYMSDTELIMKGTHSAADSSMDLSKSLDSILQEAAGSEVYNSEWERQNSTMTQSFDTRYNSGELSSFPTGCSTRGPHRSTSSMEADFRARATFTESLTQSQPVPALPPSCKRQVHESYHYHEERAQGSYTPTNETEYCSTPTRESFQSLHVDTDPAYSDYYSTNSSYSDYYSTNSSYSDYYSTNSSYSDYYSTNSSYSDYYSINSSSDLYVANRPMDFPTDLYPGSTSIELSESEVQYVHPRHSNIYSETFENDRALGEDVSPRHPYVDDTPLSCAESLHSRNAKLSDSRKLQTSLGKGNITPSPQRVIHHEASYGPRTEPIAKGESGHIVIRRPLGNATEGALHHAQVSKVTPPKRQIADAPLPPSVQEEEDVPVTEINEVSEINQNSAMSSSTFSSVIESPLDDQPPPTFVHKLTSGDGYMADRSSSVSPAFMEGTMQTTALGKLDTSKFNALHEEEEKPSGHDHSADMMFRMDDVAMGVCALSKLASGSSEDVFVSDTEALYHYKPMPTPRQVPTSIPTAGVLKEMESSGFSVRSSSTAVELHSSSSAKRKKGVRELLSRFETPDNDSKPKSVDKSLPVALHEPNTAATSKTSLSQDEPQSVPEIFHGAEQTSPTCDSGFRSMEMYTDHSQSRTSAVINESHTADLGSSLQSTAPKPTQRHSKYTKPIPVPTASASPPQQSTNMSWSPLGSKIEQLEARKSIHTKLATLPRERHGYKDDVMVPVLQSSTPANDVHGDTRSSTSFSEKLRHFEQMGAPSDTSSACGTLKKSRPLSTNKRKSGMLSSKKPEKESESSADELSRKMTERRKRWKPWVTVRKIKILLQERLGQR